jgi:hypothetical protein
MKRYLYGPGITAGSRTARSDTAGVTRRISTGLTTFTGVADRKSPDLTFKKTDDSMPSQSHLPVAGQNRNVIVTSAENRSPDGPNEGVAQSA